LEIKPIAFVFEIHCLDIRKKDINFSSNKPSRKIAWSGRFN